MPSWVINDIDALKNKADYLQDALDGITTRVASLEVFKAEAIADINSIKADIDALRNALNDINTAFSNLSSRVGANESNISALSTRLTDIETGINNLLTRVTTLESGGSGTLSLIGSVGNSGARVKDWVINNCVPNKPLYIIAHRGVYNTNTESIAFRHAGGDYSVDAYVMLKSSGIGQGVPIIFGGWGTDYEGSQVEFVNGSNIAIFIPTTTTVTLRYYSVCGLTLYAYQ